jgi:two-component system NarL family response regulator
VKIRVLVADDHPVTRDGMVSVVESAGDMEVVGEAADGEEAVRLFRELQPDIALLDLKMPRKSGTEATAAILAELPKARVILLSAVQGDEDIYRALEAGARGYLLKDFSRQQLLEAIRAVHAGERRIPAEVAARLAERVVRDELTAREREVLGLMVRGRTNRQIADDLGISESRVKGHVNNIFGKLDVTDRAQAVVTALRRGLAHID